MELLKFNGYKHLQDFIYDVANHNYVACVVLSYEKTCELLKELLVADGVSVGSIYLESEDYSGYDREYYVTLDTDLIIDIFPAWYQDDNGNGKYLFNEADVYFIDGDAHSSILSEYKERPCYEIDVEDNDECEKHCDYCNAEPHKEFRQPKVVSAMLGDRELFRFLLS